MNTSKFMKSKKIKICHIVHDLTGKADGRFVHLKMIFQNLKDNYEHVLICQSNELIRSKLVNEEVELVEFDNFNKKFFPTLLKIVKTIKDKEVDIIQTHSVKTYISIGLINIFLRRKHIFNYNGVFIFNKYYTLFQKIILYLLHLIIYYLKGCNLVIAPSYHSCNVLLRESKKFRSIKYYYNCAVEENNSSINHEIASFLRNKGENFFLIGVISRIEIQKRIDLAIELVKIILNSGNKDIFFVFMGDGPLLEEMKLKARKNNLEHNLIFLDYVENARNYIKFFKLILFTSEWEGFPLTIWEAMKEGVPIVSSDVGGVKEILEKYNCGKVYNFNDLLTCKELILNLKNDPELYYTLSKNCIRTYHHEFGKEKFIKYFDEIYSSLIKKT